MTSDLCTEDVVVRITAPPIITQQQQAGGGGGGGGGAELGRRLLLAARGGDTAQVLELMARGAPFSTDWLGTSALHLAAAHAHGDTCAVLLRAGVSRDARSKVERTPLHEAAAAGHARVLRLLLRAGALPDARDLLRMTPLHWAVQRGHAAAASELLRAGADPRALNKFHKSPQSLAAELRRDDLLRLIDDELRQRDAARSVSALVSEEMADITPTEAQIQTFDPVQRIQELNPTETKQTEKTVKTEQKHEQEGGAASAGGSAAALLRQHGITLLPTDDGSTVLNALQSGRTVVLSDAGKLMLKESSEPSPPPAASRASPPGVLLTATPVTSPPRPGVKIFTLNNKLLAAPRDGKKIVNPQDMQVKFVQLPPDAKIISPSKIVPMKAKNRLTSRAATPVMSLGSQRPVVTSVGSQRPVVTTMGSQRPAVKIIMNKSNFNRLIANATRSTDHNRPEVTTVSEAVSSESPEDSLEVGGDPDSPRVLRAQLAAAQRALAALRHELRSTRARLAHYERQHAP